MAWYHRFFGLADNSKTEAKLDKILEEHIKSNKKDSLADFSFNTRIFRGDKGIKAWQDAVQNASDAPYYNRFDLYELIKKAELEDDQIIAQRGVRRSGVLAERYLLLNNDGTPNKEATETIDTIAFKELIKAFLAHKMYGVQGVELTNKDGKLHTYTIEHWYLSPEKRQLLLRPKIYHMGVDLDLFPNVLLFYSKDIPLGLLAPATMFHTYKNFSIQDWARHSEKFGTPHTVLYSNNTSGQEGLKRKDMLQNFGKNAWAVLSMEEKLELLMATQANPQTIYAEMWNHCDASISKILAGQTATTDKQAYVGSAEVQERILDWFIEEDMRDFEACYKEYIQPHLQKLGFEWAKYKFKWEYFWKKDSAQGEEDSKEDEKEDDLEDQDLKQDLKEILKLLRGDFTEGCC